MHAHRVLIPILAMVATFQVPTVGLSQPAIGGDGRIVPANAVALKQSFAPIVKRAAPAVVNISSKRTIRQDGFFERTWAGVPRERVIGSLGSGVIVRADGVIVTNYHVIEGGQEVTVGLFDRREFPAHMLLADERTDLAVLKIDLPAGEKLPVMPISDRADVQVGDLVLAIGDPFGVGQTVTMGIVSALARTQGGAGDYQFFIQTDAAINPGNSGGALITTDGRLAGINTAIYSRTGEYAGIGFAIPANLARRVVEGVQGGGRVQLAWIGAEGQPVGAAIAATLGLLRPEGVIIRSVFPGGPVADAGIHQGDVILSVEGDEVDDMQSLNYRIATRKPGDTVHLRVSAGHKMRDVAVKLALPPETPPRDLATIGGRNPLTGAKVENLSPAVD